jgi:transposase
MRFVRELTREERQELKRMTQQEVGRVAMRAHMILLSAKRYTVPQIADIHQTSDVTIYAWFDRFDADGTPGLYDRPRSGRPPKVDDETEQAMDDAVSQSPTDLGYNFTYWTVPLLTQHLQCTLEKTLCPETVRHTLHDLGFRWRRPRWAAPHDDPEAARLMWLICNAIFRADDETIILVEDETIFKRLPLLRRMWMRQGQQVRIPTPLQNDDFCLYGSLELFSGQCHYAFFDKTNSDSTIAYLEQLNDCYSGRDILLIWDQASYHTSRKVEDWLADHPNITVFYLPKRSPQLNPVEAIWRLLKNRVAANLTRTLDAIQSACELFFEQHHSHDLLRMAGLLPIS